MNPDETSPVVEDTEERYVKGKFNEAELKTAVAELYKGVGHPIEGAVWGDGGMFATPQAAATNYAVMQAQQTKRTQAEAELAKSKPADGDVFARAGFAGLEDFDTKAMAGELSDDQIKALEGSGLPSGAITEYVNRSKALTEMAPEYYALKGAMKLLPPEGAAYIQGVLDDVRTMVKDIDEFVPEDEREDLRDRLNSPRSFAGAIRELGVHKMSKNENVPPWLTAEKHSAGGGTGRVTGTPANGGSVGTSKKDILGMARAVMNGEDGAADRIREAHAAGHITNHFGIGGA